MDYTLRLPDATELPGKSPVVVIGPNGSGKTRKTRQLTASVPIDFVNALRNTRVNPDIPAMGYDTARNNFASQRAQAKNSHWDLASDFDVLLSQLLAQDAMSAIEYTRKIRLGYQTESLPPLTPLSRVEDIWREVYPGRELLWRDWKPLVRSVTSGSDVEYSGNQMSDGEKAALYLAGRVVSAEPGIIVVDEPETHLHSLLAIRLWNILEKARKDLRFVYVTHDLSFALSRQNPRFILSSPTAGLRVLDLGDDLPNDVAEVLLGSASLSFYASRLVFCEGEETSIDAKLYDAWFSTQDTVVRSVGSCQMVLRCVEALRTSKIANSLTAEGIIDRDFHPAQFLEALPTGIYALKVHEVECLLCLPDVVSAVAKHHGKLFSHEIYLQTLADSVTDSERHKVIIERWKRRLEPNLIGLISSISARPKPLDDIVREIPAFFDHTGWSFSPEKMLEEEKIRVESASPISSVDEFLALIPGKKFIAEAARMVDMTSKGYVELVINALNGTEEALSKLGFELRQALNGYLPHRTGATSPAEVETEPILR
jgi:AAA domain, putative AbiEii toxin, Type IV TA system